MVVVGFCFGRGHVADLGVEAAVVEPLDVGEGGELDVLRVAPRALGFDELVLVEPVEALGQGVVVALTG